VDQIYRAEFDGVPGRWIVCRDPHYTAIARKAPWLDKLIAYMKSKPGVWFATHEDVAKYVKKMAE
jgi:hypothetical protein